MVLLLHDKWLRSALIVCPQVWLVSLDIMRCDQWIQFVCSSITFDLIRQMLYYTHNVSILQDRLITFVLSVITSLSQFSSSDFIWCNSASCLAHSHRLFLYNSFFVCVDPVKFTHRCLIICCCCCYCCCSETLIIFSFRHNVATGHVRLCGNACARTHMHTFECVLYLCLCLVAESDRKFGWDKITNNRIAWM